MLRGWYTAVSGMRAQQWRLDSVANNLSNVNTDGYKREQASFKAFPELLIRRMSDDGVYRHPFGSADVAPIIGRLGTGVEFNELYVSFEQGALKETFSDFDLALDGHGFFAVSTPYGERYTRNGSFHLGLEGFLLTKEGYQVLGENGPIQIKENNFQIDKEGRVWVNAEYDLDDPNVLISRERNTWAEPILIDTLKVVEFELDRYLRKQGSSLFRDTEISGPAMIMDVNRPAVLQGFVEAANVEPVREMIQMIEVNRAYEANQKAIQSHDTMLGVLINQVARVG